MNDIELDPRKLLGFKIIANEATATLHSPKIGGKQCAVVDTPPVGAGVASSASAHSEA